MSRVRDEWNKLRPWMPHARRTLAGYFGLSVLVAIFILLAFGIVGGTWDWPEIAAMGVLVVLALLSAALAMAVAAANGCADAERRVREANDQVTDQATSYEQSLTVYRQLEAHRRELVLAARAASEQAAELHVYLHRDPEPELITTDSAKAFHAQYDELPIGSAQLPPIVPGARAKPQELMDHFAHLATFLMDLAARVTIEPGDPTQQIHYSRE